jgi:hypothetical protein
MANNIKDPIYVSQISKYINDGLTVTSNNTDIMPRDIAGNIIVQENSYLVIETNSFNINNSAVLDLLNTRFNYFKFPARTIIKDLPDIDINIDIDPVFARYKPPYGYGEGEILFNATSYDPVDFSEVVEGLPQVSPSSYTITKEIKESGIDLRFRSKINYRVDSDLPEQFAGFSIIKSGPDYAPNPEFRKFPDQENLSQYAVRNAELDIIILNSQFEIGDEFQIGAQSKPIDANHSINGGQSYWVISDAAKNVDEWNREIE